MPKSLKWLNYSTQERPNCKLTEITPKLEEYERRDIHRFELVETKKMRDLGFDKEEVEEWIEAELEANDHKFNNYLRDAIKIASQEFLIIKISDEKLKEKCNKLKERCNKFDWCQNRRQINTSENLCHLCFEQKWK